MHEVKMFAQTHSCLLVVSGTVCYKYIIHFFDPFRAWQTTLEYAGFA